MSKRVLFPCVCRTLFLYPTIYLYIYIHIKYILVSSIQFVLSLSPPLPLSPGYIYMYVCIFIHYIYLRRMYIHAYTVSVEFCILIRVPSGLKLLRGTPPADEFMFRLFMTRYTNRSTLSCPLSTPRTKDAEIKPPGTSTCAFTTLRYSRLTAFPAGFVCVS